MTAITTSPGSVSTVKKLVLLAPVAALVLAGCAQDPTVAAKIGGQAVPVSDVSIMANYLCASAAQGGQTVSMTQVNQVATTYLFGAKALKDLAARSHITLPTPPHSDQADPLTAKLPAGQRSRATQLINEVNAAGYFFAQRGVSGQQILSEFASLIDTESKAGRLMDNPAYPSFATGASGSLSTAVSAVAKSAASSQPSSAYVAALPAGQKCG